MKHLITHKRPNAFFFLFTKAGHGNNRLQPAFNKKNLHPLFLTEPNMLPGNYERQGGFKKRNK